MLPEAEIISLWEVYCEHGLKDIVSHQNETLALHDACTARYNQALQKAVRQVADTCGAEIEDLTYSGELTKCCGFGGLVPFANPTVAEKMTDLRIQESDREYLVYCVMCQERFRAAGKKTRHLLDLLYPDLPPLEATTFSKRQQNRKKLKEKLLKERWHRADQTPGTEAERMQLLISEEMQWVIDRRLILLDDIRKVIQGAEASNQKILHPKNGHCTAKLQIGPITYWVEYEKEKDAFRVHKAYSHRLELNKDIKENEHRKYSI